MVKIASTGYSTQYSDPEFYRVTAADGFVDVMKAADLASVIFFADGADVKQELTDNKEALHDAVNDVFSAGTTNYEEAIQKSMDALSTGSDDTSENIIIFLSDGGPTKIVNGSGIPISPEDFDYSIIDEAADAGIKIYTVGLVLEQHPDPMEKQFSEKLLNEQQASIIMLLQQRSLLHIF